MDLVVWDKNTISSSKEVIMEIESKLLDFFSGILISVGGKNLYINWLIWKEWSTMTRCFVAWDKEKLTSVEIN